MQRRDLVYNSFTTARSHFEGARAIVQSPVCQPAVPPRMLMPIYLMVGFAIELYLKSYLADHNAEEKALKRLGHDLAELFGEAKRHGLVAPDDEAFEKIVGWVGPPHKI